MTSKTSEESATNTYLKQLGEIYKHECLGSRKKESCHQLGEFYMSVEKNIGKAKDTFKMACEELGLMESCFALANLHLTQKDFKDPEEALRLYTKACNNNQPGACNNAGLMFQSGIEESPVKQDMQKAMDYFDRGCKGGNRNGCFNLSAIYLMGKNGIEKDMAKAFELSRKSCEMGHPWSCANVSRMYSLGDGVEKNLKEAEKYKKLAKKHSGYEINI